MDKNNIIISAAHEPVLAEQDFELVERKGVGHPDSICDGIVEAVCLRLCREYQQRFGRILHHNIDKSFLVAGQSQPRPGGGRILQPMRFILGDRAVYEYQGDKIAIGELAEATAAEWLSDHLRFVEPKRHLLFQNEIKHGSSELVDNFLREKVGANDTSVGVGYAPLSPTEQLVLAVEKWLNSSSFKREFPETGEDIKVMGCRRGGKLQLIVAIAFVDCFIDSPATYFEKKTVIKNAIETFIATQPFSFETVTVEINTLDDPGLGEGGDLSYRSGDLGGSR